MKPPPEIPLASSPPHFLHISLRLTLPPSPSAPPLAPQSWSHPCPCLCHGHTSVHPIVAADGPQSAPTSLTTAILQDSIPQSTTPLTPHSRSSASPCSASPPSRVSPPVPMSTVLVAGYLDAPHCQFMPELPQSSFSDGPQAPSTHLGRVLRSLFGFLNAYHYYDVSD